MFLVYYYYELASSILLLLLGISWLLKVCFCCTDTGIHIFTLISKMFILFFPDVYIAEDNGMYTRSFFGEEFCYVMDAKSMGNIGRYLNVSRDCENYNCITLKSLTLSSKVLLIWCKQHNINQKEYFKKCPLFKR